MPVSKELLEILCCPKTRVELEILTAGQLTLINNAIAAGGLNYVNGEKVEAPLQEGLITKDKATIYRVDDDIPIMLIDKGIPAAQVKDL